MTDLECLRSDLKKLSAYDPAKPVQRDLLEQVANDLAIQLGADTAYVMELFEKIASDTAPEGTTAERVLQSLFDVLAPYQNGMVTRPTAIEYAAIKLPDNLIDMTRRNFIEEVAIQECGWPMGTTATNQGERFELSYDQRRAYVLRQSDRNFLIPRYGEALSKHIEQRDRAFLAEPDDEDPFLFLGKHQRIQSLRIGFATRYLITKPTRKTAAAPSYGKRASAMIIDDAIDDEDKPNDRADVIRYMYEAVEAIKRLKRTAEEVGVKVFRGVDYAIDHEDDLLALQEAPTGPLGPTGAPGHPRSPERRSRGPPGARNGINRHDEARGTLPVRGLRFFGVFARVDLDELRKAIRHGELNSVPRVEDRCPFVGCYGRASSPDGGVLFCPAHHFKCNTAIEGRHECAGRVSRLGEICDVCKEFGRHPRERKKGYRYGSW